MSYISRSTHEQRLCEFLEGEGSGLIYLRGRRRIGKSTLLKFLQETQKSVFYFIGIDDELAAATVQRFARSWDQFTKNKKLTKLKSVELTWNLIFDEITAASKEKNIVLFIDEIQWIAKGRSGFVGTLKEKWLDWKNAKKIKVLICGSSNKFFIDHVGGEEKVLRGLKTSADVVLPPLELRLVHKHYFKDWLPEEVLFTYMCFGGVPYYLEQIVASDGFIQSVNKAAFTANGIFLSEIDEVLRLDFNAAGVATIKEILSALGATGSDQKNISSKIKLSDSTISDAIRKLVEYQIIFSKKVYKAPSLKDTRGSVYYLKDLFMLFYFTVLKKYSYEIENNSDQLLFASVLQSPRSYYVQDFSGRAFEILIQNILTGEKNDTQAKLLKMLGMPNAKFDFFDQYKKDVSIVDFFIYHSESRFFYGVECKWTASRDVILDGMKQITKFQMLIQNEKDDKAKFKGVLISNFRFTKALKAEAQKLKIKLVQIQDILK